MPGVPAVAPVWPSEAGGDSLSRVPGTGPSRPAGFGKDKRIRTSVEFEALMRAGTRRTLNGFTFFFCARPAGPARLGILISRKHAALAVDRNRIKRCIREAFRQVQGGLGAMDVLVRPPYGLKPTSETVGRLKSGLERLAK
jgi:ribonuclease P protein component